MEVALEVDLVNQELVDMAAEVALDSVDAQGAWARLVDFCLVHFPE